MQLRFALLREREHRCALGDLPSCDYFRSGYFDEDELLYEVYNMNMIALCITEVFLF